MSARSRDLRQAANLAFLCPAVVLKLATLIRPILPQNRLFISQWAIKAAELVSAILRLIIDPTTIHSHLKLQFWLE